MKLVAHLVCVLVALLAVAAPAGATDLFVRCETDSGSFLIQMQPELAPHHVGNFTHLARAGFFDGLYFHRVVPGFVIQGGDPNTRNAERRDDGTGGPTLADVLGPQERAAVQAASRVLEERGYVGLDLTGPARLRAEFSPTAEHQRGTLSMARSQDPNSAGSQFFVCVADAPALDNKYSIFGQVVAGMDAVDRIVGAQRDAGDNPVVPIRIIKMTVLEGTAALTDAERAAAAGVTADPR